MRIWRTALVLMAAVPAVATAVPPAAAATDTFTDRANDARRGVDIRSVHVANERTVLVRTTFDSVNRRRLINLYVYLDTNRRNHGPEYYLAGGIWRGTDWQALRIDGWHDRTPRLLLHCDVDLRVRYGRSGTATYEVARGCLRLPDEVRVSVKSQKSARQPPVPYDWAPRRQSFSKPVDHR